MLNEVYTFSGITTESDLLKWNIQWMEDFLLTDFTRGKSVTRGRPEDMEECMEKRCTYQGEMFHRVRVKREGHL